MDLDASRLFKGAFIGPFVIAMFSGAVVWYGLRFVPEWGSWLRLLAAGLTGLVLYGGLVLTFVMRPAELSVYFALLRGGMASDETEASRDA